MATERVLVVLGEVKTEPEPVTEREYAITDVFLTSQRPVDLRPRRLAIENDREVAPIPRREPSYGPERGQHPVRTWDGELNATHPVDADDRTVRGSD
jgi:hypothetical protein